MPPLQADTEPESGLGSKWVETCDLKPATCDLCPGGRVVVGIALRSVYGFVSLEEAYAHL